MEHRPTDKLALISGLVFIVLGFIFLLERLGVLDVSPSIVLPVILVALGVGLLIGRADAPRQEIAPPVTDEAPATEAVPPPEERSDDAS